MSKQALNSSRLLRASSLRFVVSKRQPQLTAQQKCSAARVGVTCFAQRPRPRAVDLVPRLCDSPYMNPARHRLRPVAALLVLLFLCQGCASLKPSAAMVPPDDSGGLKVSDDTRTGIEYVGYPLYWAAMLLGGGGYP